MDGSSILPASTNNTDIKIMSNKKKALQAKAHQVEKNITLTQMAIKKLELDNLTLDLEDLENVNPEDFDQYGSYSAALSTTANLRMLVEKVSEVTDNDEVRSKNSKALDVLNQRLDALQSQKEKSYTKLLKA